MCAQDSGQARRQDQSPTEGCARCRPGLPVPCPCWYHMRSVPAGAAVAGPEVPIWRAGRFRSPAPTAAVVEGRGETCDPQ